MPFMRFKSSNCQAWRNFIGNQEIGSIDFSLNSAFSHLNHFAVWLSLFLAFFIDIGVPLVVRIIQSNGKDGDDVPVMFANKSTGPRVL